MYWPYVKENHVIVYVGVEFNHPATTLRQIPRNVAERLSLLSCNKDVFEREKGPFQRALERAGYKEKLEFIEGIRSRVAKSSRKRTITWFNPPYNQNVKTNIGREFLRAIEECFPRGHKLHSLINRNNFKISYSCMPSMATRFKNLNVFKLKQENRVVENEECKCRNNCPLEGNCKVSNIIYKAEIVTKDNQGATIEENSYIGLTSTPFIERYRNHLHSFLVLI